MLNDTRPIWPIWLWPEGEKNSVRLWTPSLTARYDAVTPTALLNNGFTTLRDHQHQIDLKAALSPGNFVQQLAQQLQAPNVQPLLCLANRQNPDGTCVDLPLQEVPFEWLWLDGQPLAARLSIARHVPLSAEPSQPAPVSDLRLADLWPETDGRPLRGLLRDDGSGLGETLKIVRGADAASACLYKTHPANLSGLIVFCHGREKAAEDDTPLTDPHRKPWVLPTANGLPALVILLACGTDEGNLIRYGRRLLAFGARSVLAPFGWLAAEAARQFLDDFLALWIAGERLDVALKAAQCQDTHGWGARRLTVIGDPGLRRAAPAQWRWEEYCAADLAVRCEAPPEQAVAPLRELTHRLTLACFQQSRPALDIARQRLRALVKLDHVCDDREYWLWQRLDPLVRRKPPERLTQVWLYPWLAQLAERHDHRRLGFYEQQRLALTEIADLAPAIVYHDWSRVAYRRGRYAQALADVLHGLHVLPADAPWSEAVPLIRDLANLLIEFNLPLAAQQAANALDERLGGHQLAPETLAERYRLQDTRARAALRGGDWQTALALLRKKRMDTLARLSETADPATIGNGDWRELAWLLYTSSWGQPHVDETKQLASEVRAILDQEEDFRAMLADQTGNSDALYLLRAFAAWTWRSGVMQSDVYCLLRYRDILADDLYRRDPGPIGFTIAYLHLCAQGDSEILHDLPDRSAVRAMLREDRYFLEAAGFDALLGDETQAKENLCSFQRACQDFAPLLARLAQQGVAATILGLSADDVECWSQEASKQRAQETASLIRSSLADPEALLRQGLMPM